MASLRQTVLIVAALNLAYFGVEFTAALSAGSVSLLADSADFLEDAAVNILIFFALAWTATRRANVGKLLAALLLIPALAFLWMLIAKLLHPTPPTAEALTLVGLGALAVNLTAALLLARHRRTQGSLTRAAFLSARNDAFANIGIIGAGLVTAAHPSIWPDIVVGLVIAAMNLDAAKEVWEAAHDEAKVAKT
ncbi:MAG: cation transporter [Tabrizicola sp.]|uniref:cation transporter n=1 Tax=Tabrizicola sp. TaxID=2005166 RepID=UPI002ABCB196|nr:cation transporter [Tabrizicola sp.]MDZ4086980.1 cation transporter [Tabrizicola sp.]